MLGQLNGWLAGVHFLSGPLGWITLGLFLAAIALESVVDREYARPVYIVAWLFFAGFWFTLIQPFFVADESIIRGIGATVAVPLSLLVAKVFYEGRDSLFTLSRAVAIMGFVYAPFLMIEPLQKQLILLVTNHTSFVIDQLGYDPTVVSTLAEVPEVDRTISGKETTYENSFVFLYGGEAITYTILLACTGIGSMSVVVGLVAAVGAPIRRRLYAIALAVGIIYVLNLVRNVFIAVAYGNQYMNFFPNVTDAIFDVGHPYRVSYIWADRILAQSASVVAMVLIIWLMVRIVPEVMQPIEDVLYLLTGKEHDLAGALNLDVETEPAAD